MNIQRLTDQRLGFAPWRIYDNVLSRLRCSDAEEYNQMLPGDCEETRQTECPIFACKFAQKPGYENILALANEDGKIAIHDTLNKKERFGIRVHNNAIFDLAWMFDQMKLVTVSGDHTAMLVDVSNASFKVERIFASHTKSVKTVAFKQNDSSVFATGSRDGNILVWDIRSTMSHVSTCQSGYIEMADRRICKAHLVRASPSSRMKVASIYNNPVSGANSVTGLVFQDENTLISCSAGDGVIKVWDLRKTYKTYKNAPQAKSTISYSGNTSKCGFSNLLLDKSCTRLYANCLDNTIYSYNILTYSPKPLMQYKGHQNNSFYIKSCLSKDGNYLLSGSSDQNAYIWNTNTSYPLIKLKGHAAEVTCVAWCQTLEPILITCSDDYRHKIWRVGPEVLPENWQFVGRGNAEVCNTKRSLGTNENSSKKIKTCQICNYSFEKLCENCSGDTIGIKRLGAQRLENENKRLHSDRCVKGQDVNDEAELGMFNRNFFNSCADEMDDAPHPKRIKICATHRTTDVYIEPSCSYRIDNKLLETPKSEHKTQKYRERRLHLSPERETLSPTTNLPNYVEDGCFPHLSYSPPKRHDKDWLTTFRIEKNLVNRMREFANETSSPETCDEGHSPRSRSLKKRKTNKCPSSQSPLLKFFRITNNSIMKDIQCLPKSSISQISSKQVNK